MHVVHNLRLWQQDNQVLGDKADSLLLHLLGNPDAGVLCHAELSADDANIGAVQSLCTFDGVRIAGGNRDFWQVRGYLLGIGIEFLDHLVNVLTFFHLHHMSSYTLGHRRELQQGVRVGDCLDVVERRHVKFLLYVSSVFRQNDFFATHIVFESITDYYFTLPFVHMAWNVSFGKVIILWPSAHGFSFRFIRGEGVRLAIGAMAVAAL